MLNEYDYCEPLNTDRRYYCGHGDNYLGKCSAYYTSGLLNYKAEDLNHDISSACFDFLDFIRLAHPINNLGSKTHRIYSKKPYCDYGYHYQNSLYDFYVRVDTGSKSFNIFVYERMCDYENS